MGRDDIRLRNLVDILENNFDGNKAALARAIGKKPEYISRWFASDPKNKRNIGNAAAREIEKAANKPEGWLDRPHWESQDDQEAQLLEYFRQADERGKGFILDMARREAEG